MNENLLKAKLKEKGKKLIELAKFLEITREGLYYKIKHNAFTMEQATKICNFLELSEKERCSIFLPLDLTSSLKNKKNGRR